MDELVARLQAIVGPGNWVRDADGLEPHVTEWRGDVRGDALILLRPSSRQQVVDIVKACNAANAGIVPQGGNTGTVAGAVPDPSGTQVIVSLSRMNRIRSIDAADFSLTADAGCILADLQQAAKSAGLFLPLSHGGEGSCQIGGNLSTNAGGINVLRYGTTRDLVLGVEVILADGTVLDCLRTLRKDTAGYDLKQLFIGAEGTLGIVTAVAVKLFPSPGSVSTALVALRDSADAVRLLAHCRKSMNDQILAFELIAARCFDCVLKHVPGTSLPFAAAYPWYVLMDIADSGDVTTLPEALSAAGELIVDAAIAKNEGESAALWRMRHSISESEKKAGAGAKHDISVPVGRIAEFLDLGATRMNEQVPEADLVVFGHIGDGNLHYNALLPSGLTPSQAITLKHRISGLVYDLVTEFGGSISAEHGIGSVKRDFLVAYKSAAEIAVMRSLKSALDPKGIMNPGKVI